jgi:hypothetical protein
MAERNSMLPTSSGSNGVFESAIQRGQQDMWLSRAQALFRVEEERRRHELMQLILSSSPAGLIPAGLINPGLTNTAATGNPAGLPSGSGNRSCNNMPISDVGLLKILYFFKKS